MYSGLLAPYETDTPGHAAMRATFEAMGIDSGNLFLVAGWSSQYHLKVYLKQQLKVET